MAITDIVKIKHKRVSGLPAPSDATKVGAPNWDDDHFFDLGACLDALAVLVLAADALPYFDATKTGQLTSLTAFARSLLAAADGPHALDVLGNNLKAFAALAASPNKFPNFDNSGTLTLSDVSVVARAVLASTTNPAILAAIGAVAKAGDAMTGTLTLAADPVSGLQAATKQYVDALAAGLKPKGSAKAASTANVTLASAPAALDTVTGIAGDIWLLKNQTAPAENGLYVFNGTGAALTRAANMNAWAQVPGATVVIEQGGAANADSGWICTSDQGGTLGTTAITWSEFFGTGLYQAASSILSTLAALASVANLTAEAGLTGAADKISYYTAAGAKALADFTAVARTLVAATTQAGQRSALGLGGAAVLSVGGANGVAGLDALGKLLAYDASALTNLPGAVPRGHLSGLTLSNDGALPNTVLDIAAGYATSDDGAVGMSLVSAYTKNCNAAWAVGTGNGALDSGASLAVSTWYHVFEIQRTDTGVVDILVSTSATAPTMPTNYTKKRRIGSIKTDASAHIIPFFQFGDEFYWSTMPPLSYSAANPGTVAVTVTLATPPGVRVLAILNAEVSDLTPIGVAWLASSLDVVDTAPLRTASPLASIVTNSATADGKGAQVRVLTNASAQIRSRASASDANVSINVQAIGWRDMLGRFA